MQKVAKTMQKVIKTLGNGINPLKILDFLKENLKKLEKPLKTGSLVYPL